MTLGGRAYRVIDFDRRTVRNDLYLQRQLRAAALDRVLPQEDETDAAYLVRLHAALIDSGVAVELIAGYLLPEGLAESDWTPEIAADTAHHVGRLDTREDRERVAELAMEAVFGFFRQGLEQLRRFRASSATSPPPHPHGASLH